MTEKINASRRQFLRTASLMSVVGSAGAPFALNLLTMGAAAAQTASDYKAIVCLFLNGGNDQANTVLATDPTSWNDYEKFRITNGAGSIALPAVGTAGGVLPIVPANGVGTPQPGRTFALHPELGPLKTLFDNGRAAVVANVGPLIVPTTKEQYKAKSVRLPPKLFSHNDQQSVWQSHNPEGADSGWGGRMGDLVASMNGNNATFTSISTVGNAVFLTGKNVTQYHIGTSGAIEVLGIKNSLSQFGLPPSVNPLQAIITGNRSNLLEREHTAVVKRSIEAQGVISAAIDSVAVQNPSQYTKPEDGTLADNPLAAQLQMVARIIGGRGVLGPKRQIFYVSMSGFDTHDLQRKSHADLLARLAHAISYFDTTLSTLGGADMRGQVTLFTASEFGRTFTSNGDGTDHGWGSHHFVVGGAVRGGGIYGSFPVTGLGHEQDVGSGSLLPSISVEQYAATLASWFGLSTTQIDDVCPNIQNFSPRNLGFMA